MCGFDVDELIVGIGSLPASLPFLSIRTIVLFIGVHKKRPATESVTGWFGSGSDSNWVWVVIPGGPWLVVIGFG